MTKYKVNGGDKSERGDKVISLEVEQNLLGDERERGMVSWGPAFGQLPLCLSLQPKRPWSRYSVWFPPDSNP